MKQSLLTSAPVALFGTLLAATPFRLLPVCEAHAGAAPMRCHWTGMVMLAFGGTFFLLGALSFVLRKPGIRQGIAVASLVFAVAGGAVASYFIGMCASPMMPCRTGTYPAVMILLALTGLSSVFTLVYVRFAGERQRHETTFNTRYSAE